MKKLFFLSYIILGIFFNTSILAQEAKVESEMEERILELSNINAIQLDFSSAENTAIIQQVGNQNNASIIQSPLGIQSGNFAQILQNGNNNNSNITQQGSGLRTINSQSGSSNFGNLASTGDNISITASQSGNMNNINATVQNNTIWSKTILLEQNGRENQINIEFLNGTTLGSELLGTPLRISQTGNQQGLNVNLDNSNSPVEITQRPGVGGQGMQVNIMTSAFPVR